MSNKIRIKTANRFSEYFEIIEKIVQTSMTNNYAFYFRGENDDHQENTLKPSIYRNGNGV